MDAGTYVAVLDRFEGDLAVLLVERDGVVVDDVTLTTALVPPDGRRQDAVFELTLADDRLDLRYAPGERERRLDEAKHRFERLARRPPRPNRSDSTAPTGEQANGSDERDEQTGDDRRRTRDSGESSEEL